MIALGLVRLIYVKRSEAPIDSYIKAFRAAELDDHLARIEQMTDAELMRVIMNAKAVEAAPAQPTQRLLVLKQR